MFKRRKYKPVSPYKKVVFGKKRVCRDYFDQRRRKGKKLLVLLGIIIAAVGIIYALFFTPWLNIREVEIAREENNFYSLKNTDIEQWAREAMDGRWLWIISRRHRWFYPRRQLLKKIKGVVPVENYDFKISLSGRLKITIKDLYPVMSIQNGGMWYYLRADGTVIKSVTGDELDREVPEVALSPEALGIVWPVDEAVRVVPVTTTVEMLGVSSTSSTVAMEEPIGVGDDELEVMNLPTAADFSLEDILSKLDELRIDFVVAVAKRYAELWPDDKIVRVTFIDAILSDALVSTRRGYRIYFDPKLDMEQQLQNFKLLKEDKLGGSKPQYIDLRYPDRLYYKE